MISTPRQFQHLRGTLLLLTVTVLWGTTFPLVKETILSLSPATLIAIRSMLAMLVFAAYLRNLNKALLRDGALLGLLLFISLSTQALALETISANRAAFIASLNVILVPLIGQLLGQRFRWGLYLAAGLAMGGVGLMSWENGSFSIGDLWMIIDVLSYTTYIIVLESVTARHESMPLTAVQMMVVAGLATAWTAPQLLEQVHSLTGHWLPILYLTFVTALTTWLPAIAQNWVSANETAIIYTLEPVFAALFSFWLLGETLGIRGGIGAVMVLAATASSQLQNNSPLPKPEAEPSVPVTSYPIVLSEDPDLVFKLPFNQALGSIETSLLESHSLELEPVKVTYFHSQRTQKEKIA